MTVLTLALLAGSQPAAPRLAPVHQIGPQSRRQSPHTPCAPLVRIDALTLTWQKADRHKRSAPTSSSHTPWPNPHSACGTAAAPLPAISCLGAFRPPAARARGEVRHCRQPKTCTEAEILPFGHIYPLTYHSLSGLVVVMVIVVAIVGLVILMPLSRALAGRVGPMGHGG